VYLTPPLTGFSLQFGTDAGVEKKTRMTGLPDVENVLRSV